MLLRYYAALLSREGSGPGADVRTLVKRRDFRRVERLPQIRGDFALAL